MKATVFVTDGGEPGVVDRRLIATRYEAVEDYDIASEYSLKMAVWALQSIYANSRCHASRMTAKSTLEHLAEIGDLPTNERGMPASVRFPGLPENRPNVWTE